MATGSIITKTEPAANRLKFSSYLPRRRGIIWGASFADGDRMVTNAKKKSFQTNTNCSETKEANAGNVNGRTMRRKILKCDAPSTKAAPSISIGRVEKKFLRNRICHGNPKEVWSSISPT